MSDTLLRRSLRHQERYFQEKADLLARLSKEGQAPETLFIGCSDSRLMPEQLLALSPGEMLMFRNIGNIVPPYFQTEIGVSSALEFAVLQMRVSHLVVCGHTDCGALAGLEQGTDLASQPGLSRWLEIARPALRDVESRLRGSTARERHEAIVERHVVHQMANLRSYPFVRQLEEANQLEIHGWIHYLERNEVRYYEASSDAFNLL